MEFVCPACKKIIKRDLRKRMEKRQLMPRGYRSYCEKTGRIVRCKTKK
jgi:hypothetical protein